MATLLQTLLIETLPEDTDPILHAYLETVLPAMEREFARVPALGGSFAAHYQTLSQMGDKYAREKAERWENRADQSLLVHVLNALLTAENLSGYLGPYQALSNVEKRLLYLGITLHDYNKYCHSQGDYAPKAREVSDILKLCRELGEKLEFDAFWSDWRQYLSEIGFLAQNTQFKASTNAYAANWPKFYLDSRRLQCPLRHLLGFADIAVHLQDPAGLLTENAGDRLREHLRNLNINKQLVYHRLRSGLGSLTNGIHNALLRFTSEWGWEAILFFASGVIYLAPPETESPDIAELEEFIWEQISQLLGSKMLGGDIGFKRDGKGLKLAPQTLEIFTPVQLIRQLPQVIEACVANVKNPATPKRLENLSLSESEREFLDRGADIRADRVAEFIILVQREFFKQCPEYITWILKALNLEGRISPAQTQVQGGGTMYGWYHAAACYVANHQTFTPEEVSAQLSELADNLVAWAESNNLLLALHSPTREVFSNYLSQYLEISGSPPVQPAFQQELARYEISKTSAAKQPICSLSSGEFASEYQKETVVLFKPQQYSNKNPLGGTKIQRGISKIWSLEMLLRQALWAVPSGGKLEDQKPIFLYIFPAYVYSPQAAKAIRMLVNEMARVNLWEVKKQWLASGMEGLRSMDWLLSEKPEAGRLSGDKYASSDLLLMATYCIRTQNKNPTITDSWVAPAFLSLALPLLLGVKVVATSSSVPLYNSDSDFLESAILDGPAGFWQLLGLPASLRIQDFSRAIERLLITYCLHLDSRSSGKDAHWQDLPKTVREVMTDVLNIFSLADEGLRRNKRDRPTDEQVQRYWQLAQRWVKGDSIMAEKMKSIERLVREYRQFYKVSVTDSSHAILLPLSKALEVILSAPQQLDDEELIWQGAGQIEDALDRQKVYHRPILLDKSVEYSLRQARELQAIHAFMTTCVSDLFGKMYRGDRALLQENRNRIKSGAEFAYRWLELQSKSFTDETQT